MPALALLVAFTLSAQVGADDQPSEKPRVLPQGVIEIHVEDLHCQSCAKKLARKLYATPGVKRVRTYVKQDLAIVELQPKKTVDLAKLWRATELSDQKPVALLVLDKRLVAEDFSQPTEKTAAGPAQRRR
ncbi:MAG: heavy-metal-associated domain-containing protein [Planctomycetota bacterium]